MRRIQKMSRFREFILALIIISIYYPLPGQIKSIGTPFIINYSRSSYQAGSQTWDIEQGQNGMMYFANNNGLLEYDGRFWKVYPMPNNSIVRSIRSGSDTIMYAGSFNEFGYYQLGKMGGAVYHSLTHLLPEEYQNFGDVWKIYIHPDGVIFQTYTQVMFYRNDTLTVIPAPSNFHFSFLVNNEFYVNDLQQGLMRYAMGNLYPLMGLERLEGKEIWGVQVLDNNLLIATASDGIYRYNGNNLQLWESPSLSFLMQNQVFSTSMLNNQMRAFGTIQNGLLICDWNGNPLQHINMEDGLQNNTILCIEQDTYGNLWLGTDLGIDYLEINSPLSQMSYNYGLSTGYAAIVHEEKLYLGTNQGLFVVDMDQFERGGLLAKNTRLIEATRGQVWTLQEIDGQLFCGHNNGTFLIDGYSAKKIASLPGGWSYVQTPEDPTKIIGGNYSGIALYQKTAGEWRFVRQFKGFDESSRTIAFDQGGSLWMAHGYKGVFHIRFNPGYDRIVSVEYYNAQNSNLASSDVGLAKIREQVVFTNQQLTYTFSYNDSSFTPYQNLNVHLDEGYAIRSIKEDQQGNVWYFQDKKAGVLRLREDGEYTNISLPFEKIRDRFVKGFEFVYPLNDRNVFFGAENGFIHYDASVVKEYNYPFNTYLRSMKTIAPDSVYQSPGTDGQKIVLEYESNDLGFVFSANDFENPDQVLFSTFMEGYDQQWSEWQRRATRDFTNLYEGNYVFRVRAKNIYGTISDIDSIGFKVLPPFRRSIAAYGLYGFIVLLALLLLLWILKRRYERFRIRSEQEQKEMFRQKEEKLQRDALEAEKQVIRIRNEKLREEMKQKDKELANSTMQTLQKNRMLITLRDELKKLASLTDDTAHTHEIKYLVRKINKEIEDENQWKVFETYFESVHEEFLNRIKTEYPDITPRELKLCAYLRMNISSKEIADLMNISTRGVEISRYRLRKKLGLKRDTNLTDFILSF